MPAPAHRTWGDHPVAHRVCRPLTAAFGCHCVEGAGVADVCSESAEGRGHEQRVARSQRGPQPRRPVGQRGQHEIAVGQRLAAGQAHDSVQRPGRHGRRPQLLVDIDAHPTTVVGRTLEAAATACRRERGIPCLSCVGGMPLPRTRPTSCWSSTSRWSPRPSPRAASWSNHRIRRPVPPTTTSRQANRRPSSSPGRRARTRTVPRAGNCDCSPGAWCLVGPRTSRSGCGSSTPAPKPHSNRARSPGPRWPGGASSPPTVGMSGRRRRRCSTPRASPASSPSSSIGEMKRRSRSPVSMSSGATPRSSTGRTRSPG
ncbi:MAG: hypothetical protein BWY91_03200 [bacterium ADurb.BinA028]|nr:MAG: hypothetical protein BWY91_03200 [bacterium ADurb.BinA028]